MRCICRRRIYRGHATPPASSAKLCWQGQEYFAECGLRNAECRPRVFRGMWDAEKICGMRYNLRNGIMPKSHLTAYKLIATINIHNSSSAVSASDFLIVYLLKYLVVRKISGVQKNCFLMF